MCAEWCERARSSSSASMRSYRAFSSCRGPQGERGAPAPAAACDARTFRKRSCASCATRRSLVTALSRAFISRRWEASSSERACRVPSAPDEAPGEAPRAHLRCHLALGLQRFLESDHLPTSQRLRNASVQAEGRHCRCCRRTSPSWRSLLSISFSRRSASSKRWPTSSSTLSRSAPRSRLAAASSRSFPSRCARSPASRSRSERAVSSA